MAMRNAWRGICLFSLVFVLSFPAWAQNEGFVMGEVLSEPICFSVINTAPHKSYGAIRTDLYPHPSGSLARHTSNFRLDEAGTVDDEGLPTDRVDFCSYGPFYEGRKLELVLRTLFPVFSCKTKIESGPIYIRSTPIEDDPMGGYRVSADCFE